MPVNTQADLSLNLAALFCMFWQMWTMRIHYALICTILVPELCFLFAAVGKVFECATPANGDTGRNSSWLRPVVYLHLCGFCGTYRTLPRSWGNTEWAAPMPRLDLTSLKLKYIRTHPWPLDKLKSTRSAHTSLGIEMLRLMQTCR